MAYDSAAQLSYFGREFYTVFSTQDNSTDSLTLRLYLHTMKHAEALVEVPALGFSTNVSVVPNDITVVTLPADAFLDEYGKVLSGMAVHVTATTDIAVLGHNSKQFSADAFIVYPKTVLGNKYFVLSWENSHFTQNFGEARSLCTVVATEDGTTVSIHPSTALSDTTLVNAVSMNAGDALAIGSDPFYFGGDLTGSMVTSNKPIAVFGGHERAEVPAGFITPGTNSTSRDHLYEQMLPTALLGDTVIAVPNIGKGFVTPQSMRILATEDSTAIMFDEQSLLLETAGDYFFRDSLNAPCIFTATKRIVGAQYMHCASGASQDPSLALILPTNLYGHNYSFICIPDPLYTSHMFTITIRASDPLVKLNGAIIPKLAFRQISGSAFSIGGLSIPEGLHTIVSNDPMNIVVSGTGEVISYAYTLAFGSDPVMAVTSHQPLPSKNGKFSAGFNAESKLTLRTSDLHPTYIQATVYDALGRELFAINQTIALHTGETYCTDYIREVHPSYLLIQEYDTFGQPAGHPVFLPIP